MDILLQVKIWIKSNAIESQIQSYPIKTKKPHSK